ncbi:MAG: hypothetical protein H8E19_02830 [Deltaproteobacteria bacterium]|uniref:Sulfotransferase domain-containing protein n=1 Tax=Candidatus Desulfacyla euxinica TaxID=2841693 RepID=A0A8J6MVT9_9DELT|nr:hypothetical protein [Candidatus Desulfacyla euxinica]
MKYKNIVCIGHPRSGTHYITALISTNFLNDPDYLKIYGNHGLPQITCDPNVVYIHIWRAFKEVAKSIYVLKERFGLDVGSYEEFLKTRYKDMRKIEKYKKLMTNVRNLARNTKFPAAVHFFQEVERRIKKLNKPATNVRTLTGNVKFAGENRFFHEVDMKPQEYWEHYTTLWANSRGKNSNVVSIMYNNMLEDFDGTMTYIAESLDSDVVQFSNLTKRVGWWK